MVWKHYLQEKHTSSFNPKVSTCLQEPQGTVRSGGVRGKLEANGKQEIWANLVVSTALAHQVPIFHGQKDLIYTCTELEKAGRKLPSPPSFKCLRHAEIRGWVREGGLTLVRHQDFPAFDYLQFKYLNLSPLHRCRN